MNYSGGVSEGGKQWPDFIEITEVDLTREKVNKSKLKNDTHLRVRLE